jgi:hypothetical protein
MRYLVLALLVIAVSCSSHQDAAPATATASGDATSAPPPDVDLYTLVSEDAIGFLRRPPQADPIVGLVNDFVTQMSSTVPACWTGLRAKLTAAYQVMVPGGSYFIFDANFTDAALVGCAGPATDSIVAVKRDGDVLLFTLEGRTIAAAHRGRFFVFGSRHLVDAAVRPRAPAKVWRDRTATLETWPTFAVFTGHDFDDLTGSELTSCDLAMEATDAGVLHVVFAAHYPTEEAAKAGEKWLGDWIAHGRFPRKLPNAESQAFMDEFAKGLQQGKLVREARTVELWFDSTMFPLGMQDMMKAADSLKR